MTAVQASASRWVDEVDYLEGDWEKSFAALFTNGPFAQVTNQLGVYADSSGMWVKIHLGQGWVQGHDGDVTGADLVVPVAAYTGTARLDGVVMRRVTGQGIEFEVLPGVNSTTLPTLTQNSTIWEELLASVLVDTNTSIAAGKVTDMRTMAGAVNGITSCLSTNRPAGFVGNSIYERDTRRMRIYDGSSWIYVPGTGQEVGCDLSHSTGQTSAGSGQWGILNMDTENWDTSPGMHTGSNGYVQIGSPGIYVVSGEIQWAANATGGRHLGIHKASGAAFTSGTPSHPQISQMAVTDASISTRQRFSKRFNCLSGDWLSLCAREDSGGALTISSVGMSVYLVGYAS